MVVVGDAGEWERLTESIDVGDAGKWERLTELVVVGNGEE